MPGMENAHALIVGIANYKTVNPLPPVVLQDAQDVYNTLVNPNQGGYYPHNVRLLLDQQATQAALRQTLADLAARSDPDSVVTIYLSGHGGQIESGPHAGEYILPIDVDYTSDVSVARTAISGAEFTDALRKIPARKVLILFDCCHSGGIGQPKEVTAPTIKGGLSDRLYDSLKQGRGRAILASSRADEYSWVLPGDQNSLFTKQLLAGIRGGIPSEDGLIRVFDLFEYLQPRVTAAQPNQHPIFKAEIEENFPVALYLGGQKGVVPRVDTERGYRYDVFVSYAEKDAQDADWVWETLLPRLEAAGLQVAISDDVRELGVSRVVNIERGLEQSRRTLIVLSPAYLADNMAQFENVMAQTMSIEESRARMIPVIVRPFDLNMLPMRLSPNIVTPADLTWSGRRVEQQWERLVRTLQSPLSSLF